MATYNGQNIFGFAVQMKHVPNATVNQIAAFFGIQGVQSIFGGTRGRAFLVSGLFCEPDLLSIRNDEALMLSYADGVPRILVDTYGYTWPNVIFRGEYQPGRLLLNPNGEGGVAQEFKCSFIGLT